MVLRGRWGSCLLAKQVEVYVRGRQLYLLSSRFQKFKLLVIWIFCLAIPLLHTSKVRLVKAMVFLAVMYECESWTVKKAELWRIDAFELSCWRRLLRVPWTARRSNQSILKEIGPGISLEGRNDAKAEAPVLWPPHAKSWLIGKDSDVGRDWGQKEKETTEDEMAGWHHQFDGSDFEWALGVGDGQGGLVCCNSWDCKEWDTTERLNWTDSFTPKIEGRKRRGRQKMRWLDGIIDSMDMSLSKLPDVVKDRDVWHATVHGFSKSRIGLSNWTTTKNVKLLLCSSKQNDQSDDNLSRPFPLIDWEWWD